MNTTVVQRIAIVCCSLVFPMNAISGIYFEECKLNAVVYDLHNDDKNSDARRKISIRVMHTETIDSIYGDHSDICEQYLGKRTIYAEANSRKILFEISKGDVIEIDRFYSSSRSPFIFDKWIVTDILFSDKPNGKP